jgi:hypothetical protein
MKVGQKAVAKKNNKPLYLIQLVMTPKRTRMIIIINRNRLEQHPYIKGIKGAGGSISWLHA